jgi:predicted RNase H-like HicB family nuclease
MATIKEIQLNTEVWKEGEMFVSYIPQLDVSSCGKTVDEARKNIREAAELFLEESEKAGTINQILEEAGFSFDKTWQAPELVALEKVRLAF